MYKILISLFLITGLAFSLNAKQIPERPNPPRLVNDFAGLLSATEARALERKLVAYDDSTSTQIAIVIENTLDGADIVDYSVELGRQWGIGQAEADNGIIIYVAVQDRKLGITTGYGSESFLTDALSTRIRVNILTPAFQQGKFYQGLDRATSAIMEIGRGEYSAADRSEPKSSGIPIEAIFFMIIVAIVIISMFNSRNDDDDDDGGYYRGGRYDMDGRRGTRRRGGGWVILPGGGGFGSGGGFGGGGFGGFGGGDFGGGGSFGDW